MDIIDRLLVVQEHDCRIREMAKECRDIPARKKELAARIEKDRQLVAKGGDSAKGKQVEIKTIELEIMAKREKITKLRQQQCELKSNEEFRAMEAEIRGIEAGISALEDKELNLMDAVEQIDAKTREISAGVKEREEFARKEIEDMDVRLRKVDADLVGSRSAREEAAKDIDLQWLTQYNAIIERKDRALVPLENGVCGGCHMRAPPQVTHNAKKRMAMIACDHCGRLLY
ncbi:MAG: C4-type zinc ribbon domain-containing protein [Verrucomicrobiota bacterium]|nr:C4-type zinc ribbon domain-containing protein [Verrucomicrobiota bacterium]